MSALPSRKHDGEFGEKNIAAHNLEVVRKSEISKAGERGLLADANLQPNKQPICNPPKWLTVKDLTAIADVSRQAVEKAIDRRHWHGAALIVRTVPSPGRGGQKYLVNVHSLPADLRDKYYLQHGIDIHAKKINGHAVSAKALHAAMDHDPYDAKACRIGQWRLGIIRPILAKPRGSAERSAVVEKIVAEGVIRLDGTHKSITRTTLYDWVNKYDAGGLDGLTGKKRADTGSHRVLVNGRYDEFFLPYIGQDQLETVATDIRRYVRGLWASGAAGWRAVSEQSKTKLIEMTEAFGVPEFSVMKKGRVSDGAKAKTQFGLCNISRRMAEDERSYQLVAIKDKDNARYQDKHAARIARDYSDLMPRDIIVGDVHPVDVMLRREDGSEVYPKAISWMDPATNEMHMTFVLCEKHESVRREYVAQSFEAMVQDWGMPKLLYLDNGSEYSWSDMIDGFTMLSKLANEIKVFHLQDDDRVNQRVNQSRESVVRSIAYNAAGKPSIEGAFGNIERVFFSTMPGWTAGDRMNKKTHQKGKDPIPFPGDAHDFLEAASNALDWYHKRPQNGRLNGRSPNEALGDYVANGWGKNALGEPKVLALAFATRETRTVDRGGVQFTPRGRGAKTIRFYHDDLLPLTGRKITIAVPAYNPEFVFCFDGDNLICIATPEQAYHPLDAAGAKEVARRNQYLRRHISKKRKHCALLSLTNEVARHIEHLPEAPDVPVAATVRVDLLEKMARLEDRTREKLMAEPDAQAKEISQWGITDADNPLLQNVEFLEDEDDD